MRLFALAIMAATLIIAGLQIWAEEASARAAGTATAPIEAR
ncbi:MAG: hypothetical protein ACKOEE_16285 [Tagaea sp.]|jgi:hypothetical protein|nr:hypothetical protein [Magnetospirillum sp.]